MTLELLVIPLLIVASTALIFKSFKDAFFVLLLLSVLLHKEVFSIYMWDVLPVRLFMLGYLIYAGYKSLNWLIYQRNWKELKTKIADPFRLIFVLVWFVSALSMFFSKNIQASVFLFGFLTTVTVLGLLIYDNFYGQTELILSYIQKYIYIAVALSLFGFFQLYLYIYHNIVIGALWNIPGNISRVGSTFWDVNHFGGFIAALLPVTGILLLVADSLKKRIIYFLCLLPMTGILLLTNSRTAWLLSGFALLMFICIVLFKKIGMRGIFYLATVLVFLCAPLLVEYSDKSSPFRARIKQSFHYRIDSFDSHFLLLTGTFQIFEKYPVLGGGYGSFYEHFSETKIAPTYFGRDPAGLTVRVPAHTIWGEAISETGGLGLSLLILLYALIFFVPLYVSLTSANTKEHLLTAAISSSIFGWFIAGIFYSYKSEFYWLILLLYFMYAVSVLREKYNIGKIINFYSQSRFLPLIILTVLASFLILINLGSTHLFPWDEGIYGQISKNMFSSGDYINLHWAKDGDIWFEKPPLYFWLTSFWMTLVGVNEWAVRLTSAFFGIGTVLLTYIFGKRLYGKYVGFLAGIILLTTVDFVKFSRQGMLDVTVGFFIALAFYLYWLARKGKSYMWILSGMSIGFAVLTKGVIGLLPFTIIAAYELICLLTKETQLTKKYVLNLVLMGAASLVVFLPWHIAMYVSYGQQFIDNYIGYHVLARATTAIEDKGRPFYWYFIVLKVSLRLWFVALLGAYPLVVVRTIVHKSYKALFLIIWSAFIFTFFSISSSKLVWYIIPTYPAIAIIISYAISTVVTYLGSLLVKTTPNIFRGFALYVIVFVTLAYFILVRQLVYFSDLTGAQAQILQEKNREFGAERMVYIDLIDLPLIRYYLDGPFEQIDFGGLRTKIQFAAPTQEVIFITKESRLRTLQETYPEIKQEERLEEWVLGRYPVRDITDKQVLSKVTQKGLTKLEVPAN